MQFEHVPTVVKFLLIAQLTAWCSAQNRPPEAISPGEVIYTANCAFCHGPGGRGGAQGGPDLAASPIVRGDKDGRRLSAFLNAGRPNKGMPAFHLPEAQVKTLAAFLHQVVEASAQQQDFGKEILVGDARTGKAFFEGAGGCTRCHSVDRDLKHIGSKYPSVVLQGRIVLPRGQGGYPGFEPPGPSTTRVTVIRPDGHGESGMLEFISDYYVTFIDSTGRRITLPREGDSPKIVLEDSLEAHLKLQERLTDRQMHDLTAYLATIR
jgi:cytochrome c oxidase cbb3-type subunit III